VDDDSPNFIPHHQHWNDAGFNNVRENMCSWAKFYTLCQRPDNRGIRENNSAVLNLQASEIVIGIINQSTANSP
jgi:hypothetical protein